MFHHKKIYSNKHLLKKGFFQFMQYFNLTLMKGDSVIDLLKEGSNLSLLFNVGRHFQRRIEEIGS